MADDTPKKGAKPPDRSDAFLEQFGEDSYGDITKGENGPRRPADSTSEPATKTSEPKASVPKGKEASASREKPREGQWTPKKEPATPSVQPPPADEKKPDKPPPAKGVEGAGVSFEPSFTIPRNSAPIEPPAEEDVPDPGAGDDQKRFEARRRQIGLLIVVAVAVVVIVVGFVSLKGDDKKIQTEQEDILNQFTKGQLKNTDDLNTRINRNKPEKIVAAATPKAAEQSLRPPSLQGRGATAASSSSTEKESSETEATRQAPSSPKTPLSGPRGSNFKKDQEIISKYEEINPAAASAMSGRTDGSTLIPSGAAGSPPPLNNRASRTTFIPGGRAASHEAPSSNEKKDNFGLHDVKLKAKLLFAVRSSASSKIVAEAVEAAGNIPIGAKFYGSANFANNRVYVSFDEVSIGGSKTSIQGTAIQGSDPGLGAEVIEISNSNSAANFAIGATKTAAQALSEAGSSLAGGAVGNMIDPHAQDLQKDKEASKMTVEYRVPAKTPFFIYFE